MLDSVCILCTNPNCLFLRLAGLRRKFNPRRRDVRWYVVTRSEEWNFSGYSDFANIKIKTSQSVPARELFDYCYNFSFSRCKIQFERYTKLFSLFNYPTCDWSCSKPLSLCTAGGNFNYSSHRSTSVNYSKLSPVPWTIASIIT